MSRAWKTTSERRGGEIVKNKKRQGFGRLNRPVTQLVTAIHISMEYDCEASSQTDPNAGLEPATLRLRVSRADRLCQSGFLTRTVAKILYIIT